MSQLAMAVGPEISPATGQHPLSVRLINRGRTTCSLEGYPAIWLSDRVGTIPFVIRHGGDLTSRRPTRVFVRSGRSAFVVLNHYRCDLGDMRTARTLRLGLPGATRSASTSLVIRPPLLRLQYCGKGEPGSTVSVSPFEPSIRAALRY